MKTLNLLICKLYDNFSFGNIRPSLTNFYYAQIAVSLLILYWLYVILYFLKTTLNLKDGSLTWLYLILFLIIFYVLKKNTWKLIEVEDFINDEENKETLNKMMWFFWALLLTPTIFLIIIFKR